MRIETFQGELEEGRRRLRWDRRAVAVLVAGVAVLTLAIGRAEATEIETVSWSGSVAAGNVVTMGCPSGHEILDPPVASFYRKEGGGKVWKQAEPSSYRTDSSGHRITASWVIPKGVQFMSATLICSPVPPVALNETVTLEPDTRVDFWCPTGYALDPASVVVAPSNMIWQATPSGVWVYNPTSEAQMVTVTGTCDIAV